MPTKKDTTKSTNSKSDCPITPVKSKQGNAEDNVKTIEGCLDSPVPGNVQPPRKPATTERKTRSRRPDPLIHETTVEEQQPPLTTAIVTPSKVTIAVDPKVDHVYKVLRTTTGQLGGNGYNGAIYGELTLRSMQRVINIMVDKCGLDHTSRVIDVGSGLGKPNFHFAQDPAVRLSVGVELEEIRWQLSMHNLLHVLPAVIDATRAKLCDQNASEENKDADGINSVEKIESAAPCENALVQRQKPDAAIPGSFPKGTLLGGVNFLVGDIDDAHSLDPFTHIYMFDLGFPPPLQKSIANKFNNSMHAVCLVSYRPPRRVIHEYGYKVEFIEQVLSSMHGSGEGHTAYIYMRTNKPPKLCTLPNQRKLLIPGRQYLETGAELDEEVHCDEVFYKASALAVGPLPVLTAHVTEVVASHMSSTRPKRERKQRVITDSA